MARRILNRLKGSANWWLVLGIIAVMLVAYYTFSYAPNQKEICESILKNC